MSFLLAVALSCSPTQILLRGNPLMNEQDRAALTRAKSQCSVLYPKSPCVRKFERVAPQTYQVICGVPISR